MKREHIDDDVWQYIVDKYGKFGDRWCDALRRALKLPVPQEVPVPLPGPVTRKRNNFTRMRLERKTTDKEISFRFGDGNWRTWKLPPNKGDMPEVRRIRGEALDFGRANGATYGQLNAISKAFSDAGYLLNRRDPGPLTNIDLL